MADTIGPLPGRYANVYWVEWRTTCCTRWKNRGFYFRAIPLLRTWHFLDFERLSFSYETKKLDLNILYQCVLTCSWHNQKTLQLLNYFHLQNFKNVRCGRDARAVTSATHVFELFKDEKSWVAEVSSDCVNCIPGHIDTKYFDQASWIYDRMAVSQRLKLSRPQQWNCPSVLLIWRLPLLVLDQILLHIVKMWQLHFKSDHWYTRKLTDLYKLYNHVYGTSITRPPS